MTSQTNRESVAAAVRHALDTSPVVDIHTHLYAPQFGNLALWGIDELLTYHYLLAEFFRVAAGEIEPGKFFKLSKSRRAELVWEHLFVRRSPISEAARGVGTILTWLGLDPAEPDLSKYRRHFASMTAEGQLERVLQISRVRTVVMTNDPLDPAEQQFWLTGREFDDRFKPVLRLDRILVTWEHDAAALRVLGYDVQPDLSATTFDEVRRFLTEWIARMRPIYLAVSLPPEFGYPAETLTARLLEQCVLPVAADCGLPLALMIGVRRRVNPAFGLAGDGAGQADLSSLANLCGVFPRNRFLCTVLSRENQHDLAVIARNFANLHVFGCWWFVNTPSLAEEITRMRIELLGHSFTPQHSDARVLEQLIYKWAHSREVLAGVLTDKYSDLAAVGWPLNSEQIDREIQDLLGASAMRFISGHAST